MSGRPLILIDGQPARPPCTGVAWSVVELVQALALEPRGARFVLATDHPELYPGLDGAEEWELYPCGAGGGGLARLKWTQHGLPALARRLGADLIHATTFPVPRRAPCPVALTVHDVAFHHFPSTVTRSRLWAYRLTLPPSLRRAGAILVNSENTARELADYLPEIADRIVTTPFGTPRWVLDRDPPAVRPPAAPVLFVGALEPRKNLAGLLEGFTRFHAASADDPERGPRPRLVVVGGGGWRNESEIKRMDEMAQKGLLERVGHCDREDLWRRLISARVLLFPSLHEGFGFPILEAMAARLPVITSDRGAMREVAGDAALRVDPDDPDDIARGLDRIRRDDELARRLSEAGADRCLDFDWRTTAERTYSAYLRLLVDR